MINSNPSMSKASSSIYSKELIDSTNGSKSFSSMGDRMNNPCNINSVGLNQQNLNVPEKEEPGMFERFSNYIKSFWEIEEEEYIDAHGFVSKRPKKKMPLRNKKEGDENNIQAEGTNTINYATQHSGFGKMFL